MRSRNLALGLLAVAVVPTSYVLARSMAPRHFDPTFELGTRAIGDATPASATPAYLTASRIAAIGERALVIDADSGFLVVTDDSHAKQAELKVGPEAGLLTYDPIAKRAYVADRRGDRIVVADVGAKLAFVQSFATPVEPYGVALSPDRKTLFVSTIADRTLVAYEAATGKELWRTPLGREPRGLAISPDGTRALISYLAVGVVDQIDLATRRTEPIALTTDGVGRRARPIKAAQPEAFARASFAVTFLGPHQAVVPYQRETPVQQRDGAERTSSYGGGSDAPVTQQLAFLGLARGAPVQATANISQHQPRALAWDDRRDALYIAGMGNDMLLQIKRASQVDLQQGSVTVLRSGTERCGADGLAVTATGNVLAWCSFTRSIQKVEVMDTSTKVTPGPNIVTSRLSSERHAGMVLFHSSDPAMSTRGALACSTCHPDNRTDGLSWRIDKQELQTPILAGRIAQTHPFKWDGGDKDLRASLGSTMKRLGGMGLDPQKTTALSAYIEGLPTIRTPTRERVAVARGRSLFESAELGCRVCHEGAAYTDQQRHKLTGSLPESDTPSLLGLAASAPYYHDGSAATLEALLRNRAAVHGMSDTRKLTDAQIRDLIAFLETL